VRWHDSYLSIVERRVWSLYSIVKRNRVVSCGGLEDEARCRSILKHSSGDARKALGSSPRAFLPSVRGCPYAAFASAGVGAGGVVEAGSVASIGTTFPFPMRLAELHAARIFGSFAAALFT
jgi:hypothetical protein